MLKNLMIVAAFALLSPLANAADQADKAPAQTQTQGSEVSAMEIAPDAAKETKENAEGQAQKTTEEAGSAAKTDAAK